MGAENTIVVNGMYGRHSEAVAAGAITPGMGVETQSDGTVDVGAANTKRILIAKEDALQGKTVSDAYAADDQVFRYEPLPGDECQLLALSGETIVVGSLLQLNAAGKWVVNVAGRMEAVEASGGALGADALIKAVRV